MMNQENRYISANIFSQATPFSGKRPNLSGWTGLGLLCAVLILGTGCYTKKIEEAFTSDYLPETSNKIILDYCKGCHIHRDFDQSAHIDDMVLKYNRKVFRYATECRTCHYLEKKFSLNDFTRKTRRPEQANRGKFKEFERENLRNRREREKQERGG